MDKNEFRETLELMTLILALGRHWQPDLCEFKVYIVSFRTAE